MPRRQAFLRELQAVYDHYKHIDDTLRAANDEPLFLKDMDTTHARTMELLRTGCVTDPANEVRSRARRPLRVIFTLKMSHALFLCSI